MSLYTLLDITASASQQDIARAYHRQALKYHPDKNKIPEAALMYKEIQKAYRLLSDANKKMMYDASVLSEKSVKDVKLPPPPPQRKTVVNDKPNPVVQSEVNSPPPPPGLIVNQMVTLEELLTGCTKNRCVPRERNGCRMTEPFKIQVKPGWNEGTKITFHGQGNQKKDCEAEDLIFIIKIKPHAHFRRDGVDLHYEATISKQQITTNCWISVPKLEGGEAKLQLTADCLNPSKQWRLPNLGMPYTKMPDKRGDIVVHFTIKD